MNHGEYINHGENHGNCVLCNPCSYCGGTADLFYPYGQTIVCIECVKDGELEGATV